MNHDITCIYVISGWNLFQPLIEDVVHALLYYKTYQSAIMVFYGILNTSRVLIIFVF